MRRILGRAEDVRRAIRALNEAVNDGALHGLTRAGIVDAIHRTHQDMREGFAVMAESAELLKAVGSPAQFDVIRVDSVPVAGAAALEMVAAEDGLYAFTTGRAIDSNPHGRDRSRERRSWRIGWNCGMAGTPLPERWDLEQALKGV